MREYPCSCSNCFELKFDNFESLITANFDEAVTDLNQCKNESRNSEDESALDEDFEDGNNPNADMPIFPITAGDSRFGSFNLSPARFLKSSRNFRFYRNNHTKIFKMKYN